MSFHEFKTLSSQNIYSFILVSSSGVVRRIISVLLLCVLKLMSRVGICQMGKKIGLKISNIAALHVYEIAEKSPQQNMLKLTRQSVWS